MDGGVQAVGFVDFPGGVVGKRPMDLVREIAVPAEGFAAVSFGHRAPRCQETLAAFFEGDLETIGIPLTKEFLRYGEAWRVIGSAPEETPRTCDQLTQACRHILRWLTHRWQSTECIISGRGGDAIECREGRRDSEMSRVVWRARKPSDRRINEAQDDGAKDCRLSPRRESGLGG